MHKMMESGHQQRQSWSRSPVRRNPKSLQRRGHQRSRWWGPRIVYLDKWTQGRERKRKGEKKKRKSPIKWVLRGEVGGGGVVDDRPRSGLALWLFGCHGRLPAAKTYGLSVPCVQTSAGRLGGGKSRSQEFTCRQLCFSDSWLRSSRYKTSLSARLTFQRCHLVRGFQSNEGDKGKGSR